MTSLSTDLIVRAVRMERASKKRGLITAEEITDPENSKYEYTCQDCETRGHYLRLKFVQAAMRRVTFQHWDKNTEEVIDNSSHEKKYMLPKHFARWPGAGDHRCDQPVRYAALREFGIKINAHGIEADQLVFSMELPGKRWHSEEKARRNDFRSTFRPVGMKIDVMKRAKDFVRLFEFFKKDPGLQNLQFFHDGLSMRPFKETYFEKPAYLYNYLHEKNAVGRNGSVIVAYLLNPNRSYHALRDPATLGGFIDRSVFESEEGGKVHLFVRGQNRQSRDALKDAALNHDKSPVLVYGEAYLSRDNSHQIEVEIFNPVQVMQYDDPFLLYPTKKQSGAPEIVASKQMALGL